ncbi:hypothetical protein [Brachyspira catarrhinii]|uniref:S9 family peptidase n=1 Tax=Brachyspira catarrhinii TaxID=2528966 RepID=A0ABY2TU72_9SPIR|nr:hypothetical protein [Brachyspira catarrhinii]TKZ36319.1 hypothetical protein EZH24_00765 [Brachyspira catarrhinii]
MRIFILFISFILINVLAFPQIYTLQRGERVKDGYILDENNFAVILEKSDLNNQKTFDILYKDTRLTGFKEAGIIRILPNNTLVATMLKSSTGKDMWTLIYGDNETEFDSIERSIFSGNNSIIFARLTDYGIAIVNGERQTEYSELFGSIINDNDFAFSYLRDGEYFININGEETQIDSKVDRMKYSTDGNELIYIIEGEENFAISNNETEKFLEINDFASFDANNHAYAVKFMPEIDMIIETNDFFTTNENDSIITNISTITNYNLSNISVYTNEEGITVKGQSNTIALMTITNIITNFMPEQTNELLTNFITNENTTISLILNGRNFGEYDFITNMSFSPDGKTLVFIDIDTNENLSFHVGGDTITNYDNIILYKYSDDSKNFVYAAQTNGISFIVLNGKRLSKDFDNINEIYFSSSNNLVYNAIRGEREYIFAEDFESPVYNNITSFKFIKESFAFTGERLGKYYYFILDKENILRREFGGYDFVSSINEESDSAISIVSDGENIFIIKNGNIINK